MKLFSYCNFGWQSSINFEKGKDGENLSHNGHPDRDLNPGPNEYETWIPLTRRWGLIQNDLVSLKNGLRGIYIYIYIYIYINLISQNRHYKRTEEMEWIEAAAIAGWMTSDKQLRNQKTCPLSHPSLSSYCTTSRYEGGHKDTLTQAYRMWTYFFIQRIFEGPFENERR
jgi:hypothetical protein